MFKNKIFLTGLAAILLAIMALVGLFLATDLAHRPAAVKVPVVKPAAVNCTLMVPADVFNHLETPWVLNAPCNEANVNQAVFVQAVILDKDTGSLSTYSPLVIDANSKPAVAPVAPVLPPHRVVGIFGGGDDVVTALSGAGAGQCDNGVAGKLFGQVFFCGTRGLFNAVNAAHVSIPPLGTEKDTGLPCPTVRDFRIVDQDQSDNTTTTYLVTKGGQTAMNTAANRAILAAAGGFSIQKNGSDNKLLSTLIDPALGCHPWKIPDIGDNGALVPTQATDELQAAAYQTAPMALIPAGDPMVGPNVLAMVNVYRMDVDQPRAASLADANVADYCENLKENAQSWITLHSVAFSASASPVAGMNLEAFLLDRLATTQVLLKCPK